MNNTQKIKIDIIELLKMHRVLLIDTRTQTTIDDAIKEIIELRRMVNTLGNIIGIAYEAKQEMFKMLKKKGEGDEGNKRDQG